MNKGAGSAAPSPATPKAPVLCFISRDAAWQKYRYDILKRLATRFRVSVRVLTTGNLGGHIHGDDDVRYVLFRSWLPQGWKASLFPGALAYVFRYRPDAILCLANLSQPTEILALLASRLLGVRFVWWTHGYDHGVPRMGGLKARIWVLLYRWSDCVITFSPSGREYLIRKGLDATKVVCAPNTLDTVQLRALARRTQRHHTREALAEEFGLDSHDRVLVFSGRLTARKKIEYAILAVASLVDRYPGIHLVLVGDGPAMGGLKRLAEEHLTGRCRFWGAVYDERILAKMLTLADIFLIPASVGLAIVHAFSYGLPIITERSSLHGPEFEYFREGYNGLTYEKDSVNDFADKIACLLGDESLRLRLSRNAALTVEEEASVETMVAQMSRALGLQKAEV